MATVTAVESTLYAGPAAAVTFDNVGASVAWVRWEGRLEMLAPADPPLVVETQGRTVYGYTRSGSVEVTVSVSAPDVGSETGDIIDGGTP